MNSNQDPAPYLDNLFEIDNDEFVAVFDELTYWSALFGPMLLDAIPLRPRTRVLDIGCGSGFPLLEIAQRLGPGSTCIGVDQWPEAVAAAERKIAYKEIPGAEAIVADAADLPFEDESFDLIVSNLGINNFSDPAGVLEEARRVAAGKSSLVMTTNLSGHFNLFYSAFEDTLRDQGLTDVLQPFEEHVAHRGSVESITSMLESSHWHCRSVRTETNAIRYLNGTALLHSYFTRLAFLPAWTELIPEGRRIELFSRLESKLNAIAAERGELALEVPAACFVAEPV